MVTVLTIVVGLVAPALPATAPPTPHPRAAQARERPAHERPSILFVLTDDLASGDLRVMPRTRRLLGERGVTFDRYYVSNSRCCPSRVTILRGQYSHNTGVWSNGGANGGFERAFADGIEHDTVATRLSLAGYRTALVGKYLNGYPNVAGPEYRPPGWHTWVSPIAGDPYTQYDYALNDNGRFVYHGSEPRDYGTDVYVRRVTRFLRAAGRAGVPFFALLSVYAPHEPATPAPRDAHRFRRVRAPRGPAFDQRDVDGMPSFVRSLPRFTAREEAGIDRLYRMRLRSLQAVDRGVAALVRTLRASGRLDDTYIVFSSDNGFHLGDHRLPAGKRTAYETDVRVPLLIRGPGIPPGSRVGQLAGNVDLAPTFLAMAGLPPPPYADGRSLLGLARGRAGAALEWRTAYLLEHRNQPQVDDDTPPRREHLPLEPPDPDERRGDARPVPGEQGPGRAARGLPSDKALLRLYAPIPDFDGLRTDRYLYVEYETGERELYDTRADPGQVVNIAGTKPRLERVLARRLDQLRDCRGRGCRASDASPITAGAG